MEVRRSYISSTNRSLLVTEMVLTLLILRDQEFQTSLQVCILIWYRAQNWKYSQLQIKKCRFSSYIISIRFTIFQKSICTLCQILLFSLSHAVYHEPLIYVPSKKKKTKSNICLCFILFVQCFHDNKFTFTYSFLQVTLQIDNITFPEKP